MDADRFDTLSRSLDAWSRRNALPAIGAISMVGLVDRLGARTARAKKK